MTCNNCERVEKEVHALKSFISGWFETFARRFDDQDEKLTVLMDAVSGVQMENELQNSDRFVAEPKSTKSQKSSKLVDDDDPSPVDDEDIKNVILFFNDSLSEEQTNGKNQSNANDQPFEENPAIGAIAIETSDNDIYSGSESPSEMIKTSTATATAAICTGVSMHQQNHGNDFFRFRNGEEAAHFIPSATENNGRDDIVSAITVECLPQSSSLQDLSSFIESDVSNAILEAGRFGHPSVGQPVQFPSSSSGHPIYGQQHHSYRDGQFPSVFRPNHRSMPFSSFHRSVLQKRYSSSTKPKPIASSLQRNHVPDFTV